MNAMGIINEWAHCCHRVIDMNAMGLYSSAKVSPTCRSRQFKHLSLLPLERETCATGLAGAGHTPMLDVVCYTGCRDVHNGTV